MFTGMVNPMTGNFFEFDIIANLTFSEILARVSSNYDSDGESTASYHPSWECYMEDILERSQGPQDYQEYL